MRDDKTWEVEGARMQKGRAFFTFGSIVALFAFAVACESESSSVFNENEDAGSDFGADTGPGFNVDSQTTQQDVEIPVSCTPSLPATFKPMWKVPTKAAVCSLKELGDYFDACLTPHAPDAGDPCKTWTDAHATCAVCIEPTDNTGPIQWHRDRFYYTLNIAGCLALERNEPDEGQCPAAYAATIQCQRASCDGCFSADGATFSDFQKCQTSARASACAGYEGIRGTTCGTTYNDPDGGAYDCFPRSKDEQQKDHFVRVKAIFCGQ